MRIKAIALVLIKSSINARTITLLEINVKNVDNIPTQTPSVVLMIF